MPSELEKKKLEAEIAKLNEETRLTRLKADNEQVSADLRDAAEMAARIYSFDMDVNGITVRDCVGTLGVWVRQDPTKPIQIIFNSPGGSVFDGLALYDTILAYRNRGVTINTHSVGMAASMGGVLLQAGSERTMGQHAHMLIHEISSFSLGKTSDQEDELRFTKRLQNRLLDILAERSTLSRSQIARRWKRKDWWLDADEALEFGFIDEIR